MVKKVFIEGMSCGHCAARIEKALSQLEGVGSVKVNLAGKFAELFSTFPDNDLALEWCEERLLENTRHAHAANYKAKPADYLLFKEFSRAELDAVQPLLQSQTFKRGQNIINAGDDAREVFFLARGHVSVFLPGEERHRLATFSPGMSFGEMAFLDGATRSANIVADTDVECHLLAIEDFQQLGKSHPPIKIKMLVTSNGSRYFVKIAMPTSLPPPPVKAPNSTLRISGRTVLMR